MKVGRVGAKDQGNINLDVGDGYCMTFTQDASGLSDVLCAKTPKGLEFRRGNKWGAKNPLDMLKREDFDALLAILSHDPYSDVIEVTTFYSVTVNGDRIGRMRDKGHGLKGLGFPEGLMPNMFTDLEEAGVQCDRYREYHEDLLAKLAKKKPKKSRRS